MAAESCSCTEEGEDQLGASEWERKSCFILCASSHSNDFSCISQSCCWCAVVQSRGGGTEAERSEFLFCAPGKFYYVGSSCEPQNWEV